MMNLKGKTGMLSSILSVVGILFFYWSTLGATGILNLYFLMGVVSWITSFALGMKAIKSKESGFLKYCGVGMISLFMIGYASIIIIIGIRGFGA